MDSDTVLESMHEPVVAVDEAGEIAYVNERFHTVTDTDREELVGSDYAVLDRYVETGFTALSAATEAALHDAVADKRVEVTMHHPETAPVPSRMPVEIRVTQVRDDDEVSGAVVVFRDVSVRADRERQLERSRRRFRAVLDTPDTFIGILDADGRVVTVNATAFELVDTTLDSVVGKPFPSTPWWSHSEELQDDLREWIDRAADGEYVRFDASHVTPDGDEVPVDGIVRPVTEDGTVVSLIVEGRDVSERVASERELERQNERLERFASVVSHDLRNPLNVATGRLELARETGDLEHLDAVSSALERMETLIDELLALTREGHSEADERVVDLGSLAGECWETVETGRAGIRVESDSRIRADRSRLRQLLENLFRNAAEHGGPDVTVTVGDCEDGFFVADDGTDIPEAERDRVFDPGYTTAESGTGFGLNIVETIADTHGWEVSVTAGPEGGACFEFHDVEQVDSE
jgi:PAS domain S-box-containing protein